MAKILCCSEIIPGCTFVAKGKTQEEVFERASEHVRLIHRFYGMSPEVIAVIRGTVLEENSDRVSHSRPRARAAGKSLPLETKRAS